MSPRVLVIGGGLVGALSALRLRDAGASVTLFDRGAPGREATHAAAGILAAQSEARAPGALFDLSRASRELHASLDDELTRRVGRSGGFRRVGVLDIAATQGHLDAVTARARWQIDTGTDVRALDPSAALSLAPDLRRDLLGAVFFERDGVVDPRALMDAVLTLAEREGVRVLRGAEVLRLRSSGDDVTGVETRDGSFDGEFVVLAAGARSGLVEGTRVSAERVLPARGQIVELRPPQRPLGTVVFTDGGYVVPRGGDRVVVGSTLEFVGHDARVTVDGVKKLVSLAAQTLPPYASAEFVCAWAGLRPYAADGAPHVGLGHLRGLVVATGHHRSGILLAPVTAEIVRDLVLTGASRRPIDALSPLRAEPASP